MTERVGLEITVDAKQANAEIQNIRKGAMRLKEDLEKQAGAVAALTLAFGAQDDAIGKVIRGVGGLAAAYGSAGNYGLALSATILAVNLLNESYEKQIRLQDELITKSFAASDAASAMLRKAEKDVADLKLKALSPAQQAAQAAQGEIDAAIAARDAARKRLLDIGREEMALSAGMAASARAEAVSRLDDERKNVQASIRLYEKAIGVLEEKQGLSVNAAMRGTAGKGSGGAKASGGRSFSMGESDLGGGPGGFNVLKEIEDRRIEREKKANEHRLQMEADMAEALAKMAEEAEKERAKRRQEIMEEVARQEEDLLVMRQAHGDAVREAELRHYESVKLKELAIAKATEQQKLEFVRGAASSMVAITSAATAAGVQAAVDGATSWEPLVTAALSAVAVQTGGIITAKGAEVAGIGIGNLALGNPVGGGQLAVGLGLVGAGVAISTGGPTVIESVVSQMTGKQVGGGPKGGGGGGAVGTGERGFGRRTRQTRDTGASSEPVQIVNVWGVDGPQAEDQARRMVQSNRVARRRRFR